MRLRSPLSPLPPLGQLATVALVTALAAWAGIELTRAVHSVAAVWFTNGMLIALMLTRPSREWPALLVAGLLGDVAAGQFVGDPIAQTVALEGSNAVEIIVAAGLLRHRWGRRADLTRPGSLAEFAVIGVATAPLCSGLLAASLLAPMWKVSFGVLLSRWYLGDALGIALVTPLALAVLRGDLRQLLTPPVWGRTVAVAAGFLALAAFAFSNGRTPLLFLLFPPLLVAVTRLGFAGAAMLIVPTAAIGFAATVAGHGPLTLIHGITPERKLAYLQVYLAVLGGTAYLVGVGVAERRRLNQALVDEHVRLARSERLYRLLADNSSDIIIRERADGRRLYASPSAEEVLGWTAEEMLAPDWHSHVHPDDLANCLRICDRLASGETQAMETYRYRRKDGSWAWLESRAHVVANPDGAALEFVANIRDVTRQKHAELALETVMTELAEQAATDPLTGVGNRRAFERSLAMEWRRAMRVGDPLALLLIDVDEFKAYNDAYGHQAGDDCLRFVARTIAGSIRRAHDLVARYGGEEFVVMLPATTIDGAERTAEMIRATIAGRAMPHAASKYGRVAVSVGVAMTLPMHDADPEALIEAADSALYAAKRQGRNRVAIAGYRQVQADAAD